MDATTLSGLLAQRLGAGPDALAFIEGERDWTVADFDRAVRQAATWLAEQGVGPGDRVALWLVNRIEWLILYFALARRGATAVAVNTRYRVPEVQHLLGLSRACLLITQKAFRGIDFPGIVASLDGAALPALRKIGLLDADADADAGAGAGASASAGACAGADAGSGTGSTRAASSVGGGSVDVGAFCPNTQASESSSSLHPASANAASNTHVPGAFPMPMVAPPYSASASSSPVRIRTTRPRS